MSKLLSERGEGKYDVLESAKELAGYTIKITSNEKKFPKRYRLSIVNKIQEKAFYIVDSLIMANEIYPNTKSEYEQRILYQKQARAACRSMMTLMDIAASTFNVNAGTLQYWTKMARDVRSHTTAWIKKDVERFKGKFN